MAVLVLKKNENDVLYCVVLNPWFFSGRRVVVRTVHFKVSKF